MGAKGPRKGKGKYIQHTEIEEHNSCYFLNDTVTTAKNAAAQEENWNTVPAKGGKGPNMMELQAEPPKGKGPTPRDVYEQNAQDRSRSVVTGPGPTPTPKYGNPRTVAADTSHSMLKGQKASNETEKLPTLGIKGHKGDMHHDSDQTAYKGTNEAKRLQGQEGPEDQNQTLRRRGWRQDQGKNLKAGRKGNTRRESEERSASYDMKAAISTGPHDPSRWRLTRHPVHELVSCFNTVL